MSNTKRAYLAEPLGFCGGVRRAMELFEKIVTENPEAPIYVLHELVHNSTVTDKMRAQKALFVESVKDIPDGAVTVFGAHGIGSSVEQEAVARHLKYVDAVCPLVAQLQKVAATMKEDTPLIFYGDREHPEVKSVLERAMSKQVFVLERIDEIAELPPLPRAVLLCQTTRNAMEVKQVASILKERIPALEDKSRVCDAVSRRQQAIYELSPKCELMLIVGSAHSSNGRRMLAIAEAKCCRAVMLENADALTTELLAGANSVGIGAATSTPDDAIHSVIEKLRSFGYEFM